MVKPMNVHTDEQMTRPSHEAALAVASGGLIRKCFNEEVKASKKLHS